jgi:anti-anti-sigma regulatory factor
MERTVVHLSKVFHSGISARDAVKKIFEEKHQKNLVLDFSNINFVTRSAADQLLKEKSKSGSSDTLIRFINVSTPVSRMFNAVEASKKQPRLLLEEKKCSASKNANQLLKEF